MPELSPNFQQDEATDQPESCLCVFRPSGNRKTLFGRNPNGDLIHIQDAGRGKTGLTCPDCGAALIARKGAVKVHHFAHYDTEECAAAGETALHREAKNLLMANPELLLPELIVLSERRLPKQIVKLDAIEVETWEGGFRPDLRATMSSGRVTRTLYIEIRVTHPVDELKLEKVRDAGHSMIEIDLSSVDRELARAELSNLLRETAPRRWLHHRKMAEFKIEILEARNQLRMRKEEAARQATQRIEQERIAREAAKNRTPSKITRLKWTSPISRLLNGEPWGRIDFSRWLRETTSLMSRRPFGACESWLLCTLGRQKV